MKKELKKKTIARPIGLEKGKKRNDIRKEYFEFNFGKIPAVLKQNISDLQSSSFAFFKFNLKN